VIEMSSILILKVYKLNRASLLFMIWRSKYFR